MKFLLSFDMLARFTPPLLYTSYPTPTIRHVLTGCLLLTFGLLTLLAPPVESHEPLVHPLTGGTLTLPAHSAHGHTHSLGFNYFFGGDNTAIHPKHFEIEWIRIYKNPKTTKLADLNVVGNYDWLDYSGYNVIDGSRLVNHVILPPDFPNRRARLFPSLYADYKSVAMRTTMKNTLDHVDDANYFWVDIDPTTGELYPDENKDGNTGRVTATEHTTVVPGDIVAIAINVKLHYYKAAKEFVEPGTERFISDPRTADWNSLSLPLWFKEDQRGPDDGVVWARNYPTDRLNQIAGGSIVAAVGIPGIGILNPNYPLERILPDGKVNYNHVDSAVTHEEWGHPNAAGYHTIVYQFEVTAAHFTGTAADESLNALADRLGGWLDGDGTHVNPFNVRYRPGVGVNYEYGELDFESTTYPAGRPYNNIHGPEGLHEEEFGFAVPFGATTDSGGNRWSAFHDVSVFLAGGPYDPNPLHSYPRTYRHYGISNILHAGTFVVDRALLDRNNDGLLDYLPLIDQLRDGTTVYHYMVRHLFYAQSRREFPHRLPPTYDTTEKGPIHYPRIIEGYVAAMTEIVDVQTETQTGPFRVTLRFQEDYGDFQAAPSHDTSEDVLATLQAALAANVEHGTVTGLSRLGVVPDSTPYQVTLVPELGVKGELTLHVPADTVVAQASGLGNLAATLTVPIDTTLPALEVGAPKIVAPEADVYTSGDKLTVEVPFAATGLTYEGEHPPYVRLYLGRQQIAENARDAIWQQGEERSGSTIVPFVYVLQASDVAVLQALAPEDRKVHPDVRRLGIPAGTRVVAPAAGLARWGSDRAPVGAGVVAPPLPAADDAGLSLQDASGSEPGPVTLDVPVPSQPVIYLPPTETDPKAVASSVPRSPVVFNELGNGSEAANDWLEFRNVSGSDVSLKDWELSVVADGKKEDTSLIVFPDVSVPANGLLLITNMPADKTPLAGGKDKGLSHASFVDPDAGLSLPDDGKFLLILRNAKEKLGLDEAFIDVAGGGGSDTDAFVRDETGDYDTYVWPLQVLEAPGDATEDALSSGKVWQRAKADIIGYHQAAWAEAAFTGIGYDRKVTRSAATAGTPGYPNGAAKTAASTPKGAVTISEIMFDSDRGKLPQWIELYNKSKTEALNLDRWQLEIQNRNSEDLIGRPIVTLTLKEKVIQPNQTLLIVAGDARASSADVFPADRVYNLLELHEKNLRIKTPRDTFLSGEGFYLKLSDRNGTKIDEVGNIDDNRRTDDAPVWVWPTNRREGPRSSVVRRYDKGSDARDGMLKSNWALSANFNRFKVESLHYGHADDIGTPGYRKGGALPVELSSFKVTRTDEGPVIVTWTTESEVDNAGFNLRRSLTRDNGFTLLNPTLIAGAGTTGERQTYTFTDTSAKPGVEYYYQIEEVSLGGRPETLRTRRLPGPVSPANRALTTFGEVKQRE